MAATPAQLTLYGLLGLSLASVRRLGVRVFQVVNTTRVAAKPWKAMLAMPGAVAFAYISKDIWEIAGRMTLWRVGILVALLLTAAISSLVWNIDKTNLHSKPEVGNDG